MTKAKDSDMFGLTNPHQEVIMKVTLLALLLVLLNGCQPSLQRKLKTQDAYTLTSNEICQVVRSWPHRVTPSMKLEMEIRRLGDCSSDHKQCVSMGYEVDTEQYRQCRSRLKEVGS